MNPHHAANAYFNLPSLPWPERESIQRALLQVPNPYGILTSGVGLVISCDRGGSPDASLLEPAKQLTIEALKRSAPQIFSKQSRTVLDLGCGDTGTDLVNLLKNDSAGTLVHWVDSHAPFIETFPAPPAHKHCANIKDLPFADGFGDLAVLSYVVSRGLAESPWSAVTNDGATYLELMTEVSRVLRPEGGLLVNFTMLRDSSKATLETLHAAGFNSITHLCRTIWSGMPQDVYFVAKT